MVPDANSGVEELRTARRTGVRLLSWAFAFSVFVNLLMLTGPLYMLLVYDRVLSTGSVETLVALTLLAAVLFAIMGVLDYVRGRLMARVAARFRTKIDTRVFETILRKSVRPKERAASANAMTDLDRIQSFIAAPVLIALFDLPWVPLFIAAVFLFHPMLGWLAVGGGLVIIALGLGNHFVIDARSDRSLGEMRSAREFIDTARDRTEIVLTQGLRSSMQKRYSRLRDAALVRMIRVNDAGAVFATATRTFRMFLQSAMLGAGAYFVILGEMSAGAMIAASVLLGRALAPVEQVMAGWPTFQKARSGWDSLSRFLGATGEERKWMNLPQPESRLDVQEITVIAPGTTVVALTGITFQIKPGQVLGVIGPSGSGKTALARTLVGYWPVADGQVRLGDAQLDHYDPEQLGRLIGYLPQNVTLFPGTIAENIARMALDPESDAVVKAAMRANAHELIMSLPEGYSTYLDGADTLLSGGQRQRIALARALFGNPVLLVLDEPNSMLDAEGAAALNRAVREFREIGLSVVIMTHRPEALAECDTLMVIANGQMKTYGPRGDIGANTVREATKASPSQARGARS